MRNENQIKQLIQNYEMEYRKFMKIESLPNHKLEFFYLNVDDAEKRDGLHVHNIDMILKLMNIY